MMVKHGKLTSLSDERAITMKYMLVVLSVVAFLTPVVQAQDDVDTAAAAAQYRLLQAENKILKAQLATLKKKLGLDPTTMPAVDNGGAPRPTDPVAQYRLLQAENKLLKAELASLKKNGSGGNTGGTTTQPAGTGATTQPTAKAGATQTFGIHEAHPDWWASPAELTFEVRLREILSAKAPDEAPAAWLIRNGFLAENSLDWNVQIVSTRAISETQAGRQFYITRDSAERLRERIKKSEANLAKTTDPELKRYEEKSLVDARVRLGAAEALNRRWARTLKLKGATILEAAYYENRKGRNRAVLIVAVVLPTGQAAKLAKYETAKMAKLPRGRRVNCPVKVTGKVDAVVYDGNTISVEVRGEWGDAPLETARSK